MASGGRSSGEENGFEAQESRRFRLRSQAQIAPSRPPVYLSHCQCASTTYILKKVVQDRVVFVNCKTIYAQAMTSRFLG